MNDEYGWRRVEALLVDDDFNLYAFTLDNEGEETEEDIELTEDEINVLTEWLNEQF